MGIEEECQVRIAVKLPQARELPEARRVPWNRSFSRFGRGSMVLIPDLQAPEQ